MVITVDTNVLFAALYSKSGASNFILRLIVDAKVQLALSPQTYLEYREVLTRKKNLKKLNLSEEEIDDILDLLAVLARKQSIYFLLRPNLRDEDDNMFFECAFASQSRYLITSNIRDFKNAELKGFEFDIITPKEFVMQWRSTYE